LSTRTEIGVIRAVIDTSIRRGHATAGISRIAPTERAFARSVGSIRATGSVRSPDGAKGDRASAGPVWRNPGHSPRAPKLELSGRSSTPQSDVGTPPRAYPGLRQRGAHSRVPLAPSGLRARSGIGERRQHAGA